MRIEREDGETIGGTVWAVCAVDEARHLFDSLTTFFAQTDHEPGWHCHVGGDGEELVVEIELAE
jgi:hypothetical protein